MSAALAAVARRDPRDDTAVGLAASERASRVMGTDAHVIVWQEADPLVPPEVLLDRADVSLARLEALWSRFRAESDVSRVNAAAGEPVAVAPETADLVALARRARAATGGRFDPTLLRDLEAAGYDRSFETLTPPGNAAPVPADAAERADRRARAELIVDREAMTVAVAPGRGLDLGGIGKGRAADVVAAQLLQEGALGACVNIGGDLRVVGETAPLAGIFVAVDDVTGTGPMRSIVQVRNLAVATSSCRRRTWTTPSGPAHHLLDPRTGRPAHTGLAGVTVLAPTAAWAEVAATAAFLGGRDEGAAYLEHVGLPGLLVTDDGAEIRAGGFEEYER